MIARGPEPGMEKRSHVGLGTPGQGFNGPKTTGEISTLFDELVNCDKQITPSCLRALYGLVYEPLSASKNSYGIGVSCILQYALARAHHPLSRVHSASLRCFRLG